MTDQRRRDGTPAPRQLAARRRIRALPSSARRETQTITSWSLRIRLKQCAAALYQCGYEQARNRVAGRVRRMRSGFQTRAGGKNAATAASARGVVREAQPLRAATRTGRFAPALSDAAPERDGRLPRVEKGGSQNSRKSFTPGRRRFCSSLSSRPRLPGWFRRRAICHPPRP